MQTSRFAQLCQASKRRRDRLRDHYGEAYHDFLRRRVRHLCGLTEDDAAPVTVASCEAVRLPGVSAYRLRLSHRRRHDIGAVLLTPAATSDQHGPAVLVLPGKYGTLDAVSGLGEPDHPDRDIGYRLARAGFVTLVYDHGLGVARGDADSLDVAAALAVGGQPPLGAFVEDALALVAWLRSRPDVDAGRVGLFGHSMGGAAALHTALVADTPTTLCVASYAGSFEQMFLRPASANPCAALPGILEYAELSDLFSALRGPALQIQYGRRDPTLDVGDVDRACREIEEHHGSATDVAVETVASDMGHGTDCDAAVGFFRRTLSGPGPAARPASIPAMRVEIPSLARRAIVDDVTDSLSSGLLSMSSCTGRFEAQTSGWVGGPPIAVASGSAALDLVFRDIDVRGRAVLVPANTFFATAAAVERAGGTPVFCDIEPVGFGTDPEAVAAELRDRDDVAAIATIHLGGIISPSIERLAILARSAGIPLVEDAAHALGSSYDGAMPGAFGDYATFSLFATKVVTSGEGGVVVARDPDARRRIKRMLDHGKDDNKQYHVALGGNARISELHAAVGAWHLETTPAALQRRRDILDRYRSALAGQRGIRVVSPPPSAVENGYKCIALVEESVDRARLKSWLSAERGVALAGEVYSRPLPTEPHYASALLDGRAQARSAGWPVASTFTGHHVCLPVYPSLTPKNVDHIASSVLEAVDYLSTRSPTPPELIH